MNLPPHSLLPSLTASQTQLQAGDGWNRPELYLWEQKALLLSFCAQHSECHYMVGRKRGKTTSDIEMNCVLVLVLLDLGSNQCFLWTSQRWKQERPPELCRAALLFQSCSSLFHVQGSEALDECQDFLWPPLKNKKNKCLQSAVHLKENVFFEYLTSSFWNCCFWYMPHGTIECQTHSQRATWGFWLPSNGYFGNIFSYFKAGPLFTWKVQCTDSKTV